MSCEVVAFTGALLLASMAPGPNPNDTPMILASAPAAPAAAAPASVASEPLFADIITRARALHAEVETLRSTPITGPVTALPGYAALRARITELAALDMQGHQVLAARNTDGDLKCILRGISQDLAEKLEALETAATPEARQTALRDMAYLLNDNVEVITSPPAPPV